MNGSVSTACAIGLVLGLLPAVAHAQPAAKPPTTALEVSSAIEATASAAGAAVVEIFTMSYAPADGRVAGSADLVRAQRSSGSGVIVDAGGYIVTNAHVVRGAQRIRVEVPTVPTGGSILAARGRILDGQVVGLDLETDLAVLKVEASGLADAGVRRLRRAAGRPARARARQPARVPQLGLARRRERGRPPARARVADGLRPDRRLDQPGQQRRPAGRSARPRRRHQHAHGVPSGAPATASASPPRATSCAASTSRSAATARCGAATSACGAQTLTPLLAAGLGLPRDHGVVLADVTPGGPAALAGLRPGDVVLALDGKPMENGRQLQVGLYRRAVGDASRSTSCATGSRRRSG